MRTWKAGACGVGIILLATISIFAAQPQIEPSDPIAHQVKVVNKMGYPIRLKIMGYRADAHFMANLDDGESTTQMFYAGQRVVCVWNGNKRLKMAAMVKFNQPGILRLKTQNYATVAGGETSEADEALPMLSVEEE